MKTIVTLEQLKKWAEVYPNMTILDFIKIFFK